MSVQGFSVVRRIFDARLSFKAFHFLQAVFRDHVTLKKEKYKILLIIYKCWGLQTFAPSHSWEPWNFNSKHSQSLATECSPPEISHTTSTPSWSL